MKTTAKEETATKHMAVRVTPAVHRRVKVAAARADETVSLWVSRLILVELDRLSEAERLARGGT